MIGQLRSELLKQRSTQTTTYLFLAMFALVALVITMNVLAVAADELSSGTEQLQDFEAGSRAGMLSAGLAGAIAVTAELRYGTIRPTFLIAPRRAAVLAAELAVGLTWYFPRWLDRHVPRVASPSSRRRTPVQLHVLPCRRQSDEGRSTGTPQQSRGGNPAA